MAESKGIAPDDEWELSKENVQPLPQGRTFSNLSVALTSKTATLKQQQDSFEAELRIYEGNDPLEVWLRYIKWTEENYPKGGPGGNLVSLLEKCSAAFSADERYRNDDRYIKICIKYADHNANPLEIFNYMYDKKIGINIAGFYHCWARVLEIMKNTTKADAIYLRGIELGAQPLEDLRKRHREFQARVAAQVVGSLSEAAADARQGTSAEQEERQRTSLGTLKTKGSQIPVNRAAAAARHSSRPLQQSQVAVSASAAHQPQQTGATFRILEDENATCSVLPPQTNEYASMPITSVITRENIQKPAKWTESKIKVKGVTSSASATSSTFGIHEDEDIVQPASTPHNIPSGIGILSTSQAPPTMLPWGCRSPVDPKVKIMYCKDKLYAGNMEFSFEEIRAHRWFAKKKKDDEEQKRRVAELERIKEELRQEMRHEMMKMMMGNTPMPSASTASSNGATIPNAGKDQLSSISCPVSSYPCVTEPEKMEVSAESGRRGCNPEMRLRDDIGNENGINTRVSTGRLVERMGTVNTVSEIFANGTSSAVYGLTCDSANGDSRLGNGGRNGAFARSMEFVDTGARNDCGHIANSGIHVGMSKTLAIDSNAAIPCVASNVFGVVDQLSSLSSSTGGQSQQEDSSTGVGQSDSNPSSNLLSRSSVASDSVFRHQVSITQPSPTVNTKEARQLVMNLFNHTIQPKYLPPPNIDEGDDIEDEYALTPVMNGKVLPMILPVLHVEQSGQNELASTAGGGGFEIFQDPEIDSVPASTGFQIFQDTEANGVVPAAPAFAIFEDESKGSRSSALSIKPLTLRPRMPVNDKENVIVESVPLPPTVSSRIGNIEPAGVQQEQICFDMADQLMPSPVRGVQEQYQDYVVRMNDIHMQDDAQSDALASGGSGDADYTFDPRISSTRNYTHLAPALASAMSAKAACSEAAGAPIIARDLFMTREEEEWLHEGENIVGGRDIGDSGRGIGMSVSQVAEQEKRKSSIFNRLDTIQEVSDESRSKGSSVESTGSSGLPCSTLRGYTAHHSAVNPSTRFENMSSMSSSHHQCVTVGAVSIGRLASGITPASSAFRTVSASLESQVGVTPFMTKGPPPFRLSEEDPADIDDAEGDGNGQMATEAERIEQQDVYEDVSMRSNVDDAEEGEEEERESRPFNITMNDPFNKSIMIDTTNPFNEKLIRKFINRLQPPLCSYPNYHELDEDLPRFAVKGSVNLGGAVYSVKAKFGEGAFAKVYHVADSEGCNVVIKIQKPACPWEFYITTELLRRLMQNRSHIDITPSIMFIDEAYFFRDGSCFVNELHKNGTLLDLVNSQYGKGKQFPEWFVLFLSIELFDIMLQMHSCSIIHGDFKPDNIIVRGFRVLQENESVADLVNGSTSVLKLIDFGQSIDMKMFPTDATFMANVATQAFQCIEMKTNRPWTYQIDLYGLISTIHVLIFGKYMKPFCSAKNGDGGIWGCPGTIKRSWNSKVVMTNLFSTILNIPSCDDLPKLDTYRNEIHEIFIASITRSQYNQYISELMNGV